MSFASVVVAPAVDRDRAGRSDDPGAGGQRWGDVAGSAGSGQGGVVMIVPVGRGAGAGGDAAGGLPQLCGAQDYAESAATAVAKARHFRTLLRPARALNSA